MVAGRSPVISRPVLAAQRRLQVQSYVTSHGWATIAELAQALDTSQTTVRRDLAVLAGRGVLVRVRGGAGAVSVALAVPRTG